MILLKNFPFYFACFLVGLQLTAVLGEVQECMYQQCSWKQKPTESDRKSHIPCIDANARSLVRTIVCDDTTDFHICCNAPIRDELTKSRQKWFRAVVNIGAMLSRSCTKRILCEQACLDGLRGNARSDYPQILDGDSEANKDYVRSYGDGEDLACYNVTLKQKPALGQEECKRECAKKNANCQADLDNNFTVECIYASARLFHKLGVWFFSAFQMTFDTVQDGSRKAVTVYQTIKKAFTDLYNRMLTLEKAFNVWLVKELPGNSKPIQLELEKKWKQFLVIFNQTDADLVLNVYESLNRSEYTNAIAVINHTLVTTDFGPGGWNGVSGHEIHCLTMLIMFIFALFGL